MKLSNKAAVITGAGSGIGRAMGALFAKEGAKVVIADIKDSAGNETVRQIKASGGEAIFVQTDVTKAVEVERLIKITIQTFGKLARTSAVCAKVSLKNSRRRTSMSFPAGEPVLYLIKSLRMSNIF